MKRRKIFLYKIKKRFKWEFAPTWVVYLPVLIGWVYWAWKNKSLTFFTAANPGIYNGGLLGESKYEILESLPASVVPKGVFIQNPDDYTPESLLSFLAQNDIHFPFILKPDRGERGRGVSKIKDKSDLEAYLSQYHFPLIAQAFITEKEEYGILYHRFPNEPKGKVTSIVVKGFLSVTGNGADTLETLWLKNPRCLYHWDLLNDLYCAEKTLILPENEEKILVEIGNHVRGTTFFNGNHLISEALTRKIDEISQQIPGFYIGRFDLKADNIAAVCEGNFKVMELNGVGAEPGHIYDPEYPILKAYQALIEHWNNVAKIAKINYDSGEQRVSFAEMQSRNRDYQAYQKKYLGIS